MTPSMGNSYMRKGMRKKRFQKKGFERKPNPIARVTSRLQTRIVRSLKSKQKDRHFKQRNHDDDTDRQMRLIRLGQHWGSPKKHTRAMHAITSMEH